MYVEKPVSRTSRVLKINTQRLKQIVDKGNNTSILNAIQTRRNTALTVRPSGRAVDFLTPDFIRGCPGRCRLAYCHVNEGLREGPEVSDNVTEILQAVHRHATAQPWPRLSNRVDERYYTYDFASATDLALQYEQLDWSRVIHFFAEHSRAKGACAISYLHDDLYGYDIAPGKVRIRLSLMPESLRKVLELDTPSVTERIAAVPRLMAAGFEVDLNFSPLICYEGWLDDYAALFAELTHSLSSGLREGMRYEANLLSHHPARHRRNLLDGRIEAESILFNPDLQELIGAGAPHEMIRYRYELRRGILREWRQLATDLMPWARARHVG